jgi:hypothetical protein
MGHIMASSKRRQWSSSRKALTMSGTVVILANVSHTDRSIATPDPAIEHEIRISRKSLAAKEKLSLVDNAGAQSGTHLALPPNLDHSASEFGTSCGKA